MKKNSLLFFLLLSITQALTIQCAAIEELEQKQFNEQNFFRAAEQGDVDLLDKCLSQVVNVNAANEYGNTALIISARRGYEAIVRMLLEFGQDNPENLVNVNAYDDNGWTALMVAAEDGYNNIVRMLLEYRQDEPENRVNINYADKYGRTALMVAACHGREVVVRMLLEYGQDNPEKSVNVNAVAKDGSNALMLAAIYGHANIIKIFAEYNRKSHTNMIDVNSINNNGLTALMLAIEHKKVEVADALLFPVKKHEQNVEESLLAEIADEDADGYYRSREEQEKSCWNVDVNFGKRTT